MSALVVAEELQDAGLYDPTAPNAHEELNLLRLVSARGGTIEEMREARRGGQLEQLAAELFFMDDRRRLTLDEVADAAGVAPTTIQTVRRCGAPSPRGHATKLHRLRCAGRGGDRGRRRAARPRSCATAASRRFGGDRPHCRCRHLDVRYDRRCVIARRRRRARPHHPSRRRAPSRAGCRHGGAAAPAPRRPRPPQRRRRPLRRFRDRPHRSRLRRRDLLDSARRTPLTPRDRPGHPRLRIDIDRDRHRPPRPHRQVRRRRSDVPASPPSPTHARRRSTSCTTTATTPWFPAFAPASPTDRSSCETATSSDLWSIWRRGWSSADPSKVRVATNSAIEALGPDFVATRLPATDMRGISRSVALFEVRANPPAERSPVHGEITCRARSVLVGLECNHGYR